MSFVSHLVQFAKISCYSQDFVSIRNNVSIFTFLTCLCFVTYFVFTLPTEPSKFFSWIFLVISLVLSLYCFLCLLDCLLDIVI